MYPGSSLGLRRDHTDLFKECRRSFQVLPLPRPPGTSNVITLLSDDVNLKLSLLDRQLSELEGLFTQRSRLTFDNSYIESLDSQIQHITSNISQRISELNSEIRRPLPPLDPDAVPLFVNLQQSHRLRLSAVVQHFREIQSTRRSAFQVVDDTSDPIGAMYADFQSPDQEVARVDRQTAEEQTELARLMGMMNELTAMFRDLSLVVFEQGTVLDRIDTRIELTVEDVRAGNEDLERANEHQRGGCFYTYIVCVMGLIGICLLVMLFRKR
jgi:syntaxin 16